VLTIRAGNDSNNIKLKNKSAEKRAGNFILKTFDIFKLDKGG
jgi:hypothetical protein